VCNVWYYFFDSRVYKVTVVRIRSGGTEPDSVEKLYVKRTRFWD